MSAPTVPTPDPIPDDLTPEERRAVARQGRMIAREVELEEAMRAEGQDVPAPFASAEWGDAEEWRG